MNVNYVRIGKSICQTVDPLLLRVEETYVDSFPKQERRDFCLVRKLLVEDDRFELYALLLEGVYVGFISGWQFSGFVYVEHFAIDPSVRNGGIGAEAMRCFMSLHEDPIVLEVEMPTDAISLRRIGFYERLGFFLDHHEYFQPPYRECEGSLEMRLMTHGKLDLEESFERVKTTIHQNVYGVV